MNYKKYMTMKNIKSIYDMYWVDLLMMVHRAYDRYIYSKFIFLYRFINKYTFYYYYK